MKFPNSNTSAESIHIVNILAETRLFIRFDSLEKDIILFMNLLRFVKADMNQVRGDTDSAFLARSIASNWTTLLEAEIGVHMGYKGQRVFFFKRRTITL